MTENNPVPTFSCFKDRLIRFCSSINIFDLSEHCQMEFFSQYICNTNKLGILSLSYLIDCVMDRTYGFSIIRTSMSRAHIITVRTLNILKNLLRTFSTSKFDKPSWRSNIKLYAEDKQCRP